MITVMGGDDPRREGRMRRVCGGRTQGERETEKDRDGERED